MAAPFEEMDWVPACENEAWSHDAVILGRDDVSDFNEENILPQPTDVLAKIRAWLRPTEYGNEGGEFKKHLSSHLPGTGDWLFSSDAYQRWHSSPNQGFLWIRGIPGSGKSVFAASIVDRLRQEQSPVLYFFFRLIIDANHSPVAALRDWLDQLLVFSPPLQAILKEYVEQKRELESLSSTDLWSHLRQATIYIPKVYCVVDALDEMDQTKDLESFLQSLAALAGWRPSQVKVVATSRPVAYVEKPLRIAKALHIRLDEHQVDIDIATYVRHNLSHSTIPDEMQAQIRAAVPGKANGLFLYAKLAMDAFLRSGADVAQVLERLPQDLNVMYSNLLREHSRRSGVPDDTQLLILQAVTHASRPLRLLEIAEFIDVTQRPPEERDLKSAKDLVRAACGPLLEILPDETVSVVHHSLTEFLNGSTRQFTPGSYPVLKPGPTHCRLALVCLSYILSGLIDKIVIPKSSYYGLDRPRWNPVHLTYPFLKYAAHNWYVHVRKSTLSGHEPLEMNTMVGRLLAGENLEKWAALLEGANGIFAGVGLTPLMVAVRLGLSEFVKLLLGQKETDLNTGGQWGSPLCVAADEGFEEIVKLLLDAGADIHATASNGSSPLLLAATNNHPRAARILIDAGLSPFKELRIRSDFRDGRTSKHSPVSVACRNGHMELATEFLSCIKKADEANQLLCSAVKHGRSEIVELALRHPLVDVNARQGKDGATVLFIACRERMVKIIQLLLQAGADSNAWRNSTGPYDQGGNTPLHALVQSDPRYRSEEMSPEETIKCFELLLTAGADACCRDSKGNSVLNNVPDAVTARLLLNAGADPNAANENGETLLHTCKNEDILRVLLEDAKADLERKTEREGLTPLLRALEQRNISIAFLLLDLGASPAVVSNQDGNGSFHFAVTYRHSSPAELEQVPRLIRRLHECGGDPRVPNRAGDTALHLLIESQQYSGFPFRGSEPRGVEPDPAAIFESILRSLLDAGADLEARDREGRTPFFKLATSERQSTSNWNTMLRVGAKLNTVDFKGETLFYYGDHHGAVLYGSEIKKYIEHGLDPKQTDYAGNTLWHSRIPKLASLRYVDRKVGEHPHSVETLVKLGIDILQPNHAGRTPLHQLCMYTHCEPYRPWDPRSERTNEPPETQRKESILQYVIGLYLGHGVDQTDNDGVTALHLASTHCEYTTRMLLEAGADPRKATLEGLNPLHLAARSREPNIIAILLSWIKSRCTEGEMLQAVNACEKGEKSYLKRTPLHFACASGQPVSVRLLLEAGAADDASRHWSCSVWSACADFEEEDLRWPKEHGGGGGCSKYPDPSAESVLLNDTRRRKAPTRYRQLHEARLEEIINLLAAYQPPTLKTIDSIIESAASKKFDYTVECLARKRKALFPGAGEFVNIDAELSLARRKANREVISQNGANRRNGVPWTYRSPWEFSVSMGLRDYDFAAEMLARTLKGGEMDRGPLHDLVASGNARVLKRVATKEIIAKLEDWEVRLQLDDTRRNDPEDDEIDPLLVVACNTKNPNMDVIHVLVEDIGVDVNIRTMSSGKKREDETALHHLVRGAHWWQSTLALPYLIEKGADIEVRDGAGLTPLLAALGQIPSPSFQPRAVELLVTNGADVNAVDPRGHSCLARAVGDLNMVRFLLENGGVVTSSTFAAAIQNLRPDVLKILLDYGADPNIRQTPEEQEHMKEVASRAQLTKSCWEAKPEGAELRGDELYPVDLAGIATSYNYSGKAAIHKDMVKILLDHGADPNATYPGTTVMHRVLQHRRFARVFLDMPSLNLEARDDKGYTLLHSACRSGCTSDEANEGLAHPADILLDRGADVRARSNDGSTALHHLIPDEPKFGEPYSPIYRSELVLRRVALAAPDIINLCDDAGHTALHKALYGSIAGRFDRQLHLVDALLSVGADPHLPDPEGNTPLHLLLRSSWTVDTNNELTCVVAEIFNKLLAAGVDINAHNATGETPLFSFFRYGWVYYAEAHHDWPYNASSHPKKSEGIKVAVEKSDSALWELFDTAGVDWKAVNNAGESLLHAVAASRGNAEYFKKLMERGLDPLREDERHRTPLDVAAALGGKDILQLFKRAGDEMVGDVREG